MPATPATPAPQMTDRMTILDTLLRQRTDAGLRDFLASRWNDGKGESWDDIALALRKQLEGTGYLPPRETVIQYALRLGIITARPKGMARRRRPRATS